MNSFYEMVMKGKEMIRKSPRKCDICGATETVFNVMLKYDNGLIMCDSCAFNYYESQNAQCDELCENNPLNKTNTED